MILTNPSDGIYHIQTKSLYEVASTFMRLQEFYESPSSKIKGKYFTLEQYMDLYAEEFVNFTYTSDFVGFNVPGHIVRKFFDVFEGNLLQKEQKLYELLEDIILSGEKFYLTGCSDESDSSALHHEYAHAFYYLDSEYKRDMNELLNELNKKQRTAFNKCLSKNKYAKAVYNDEMQAYFATSDMIHLTDFFETDKIPWDTVLKVQRRFREDIEWKLDNE